MKLLKNLQNYPAKRVRKYGKKIAKHVETWLFDYDESYYELPINLQISLADLRYLEECSPEIARLVERKKDYTRCAVMKVLYRTLFEDKPNSVMVKKYLEHEQGMLDNIPDPNSRVDLASLFQTIANNLPK